MNVFISGYWLQFQDICRIERLNILQTGVLSSLDVMNGWPSSIKQSQYFSKVSALNADSPQKEIPKAGNVLNQT